MENDIYFTTLQQAASDHSKPDASSSTQHCHSSNLRQLALQFVQTPGHVPATKSQTLLSGSVAMATDS